MAKVMDIVVPDGISGAAVVEIMQSIGAQVVEDESLLAIETDKATAEVPAPVGGKLLELSVQVGAMVSSGDVIGKLEIDEPKSGTGTPDVAVESSMPAALMDILVPDGISGAAVVEIMSHISEAVAAEESLIAIETDKATAEVPAPQAGTIAELLVQIGDKVSSGDLIGRLQISEEQPIAGNIPIVRQTKIVSSASSVNSIPLDAIQSIAPENVASDNVLVNEQNLGAIIHASPSVRQFARELGVNLRNISTPSGPKGRITFSDVRALIKAVMARTGSVLPTNTSGGSGIPSIELPDFSKFGPTEKYDLSKIKQVTGKHLHAGWLNIPLVTHFEETDITQLEEFRQELNKRSVVTKGDLPKTTPLAFIVKAVVRALQQYPQVNSSLDIDGQSLILKKYYNIGIAVDTPRGLLVPVIKNADKLSLDEISTYIKDLASKGRSGKLGATDMEGGCFTISSLGGLGGTNFTPLVNSPEAAILGVAKSSTRPQWNGQSFEPCLILPFSVSYDHRILDGGEVARFATTIASYLRDLRYLLV